MLLHRTMEIVHSLPPSRTKKWLEIGVLVVVIFPKQTNMEKGREFSKISIVEILFIDR